MPCICIVNILDGDRFKATGAPSPSCSLILWNFSRDIEIASSVNNRRYLRVHYYEFVHCIHTSISFAVFFFISFWVYSNAVMHTYSHSQLWFMNYFFLSIIVYYFVGQSQENAHQPASNSIIHSMIFLSLTILNRPENK